MADWAHLQFTSRVILWESGTTVQWRDVSRADSIG